MFCCIFFCLVTSLNGKTTTIVNTKRFDSDTDFHNIPDGLYSFNTNTPSTNSEYMLPPIEKLEMGFSLLKLIVNIKQYVVLDTKG